MRIREINSSDFDQSNYNLYQLDLWEIPSWNKRLSLEQINTTNQIMEILRIDDDDEIIEIRATGDHVRHFILATIDAYKSQIGDTVKNQ